MKYLFWLSMLVLLGCQNGQGEEMTDQQASAEEWVSLFNGKNLEGWTIKVAGEPLNTNYKNTFRVHDDILEVNYDEYENFDDKFGHLYYHQPYAYYKLKFDYRFRGEQTPGGAVWNVRNSGVMIHSQSAEDQEPGQGFPVSIEVQLLGGLGEAERTTANLCTPGTAVVMGDTINYNHCINSSSKTYHGDQWVSVEVLVLGDSLISHIVEGDTVLTYEKPQIGGGFISKSLKGEDWKSFRIEHAEDWIAREGELLPEGYIALQAESHPIDFRNITLLNLKGCTDKKAKNYKSYYLQPDPSQCHY